MPFRKRGRPPMSTLAVLPDMSLSLLQSTYKCTVFWKKEDFLDISAILRDFLVVKDKHTLAG